MIDPKEFFMAMTYGDMKKRVTGLVTATTFQEDGGSRIYATVDTTKTDYIGSIAPIVIIEMELAENDTLQTIAEDMDSMIIAILEQEVIDEHV